MTVDWAKDHVKWRVDNRERMFLEMVEDCIFGHPGSPYLPLLRAAGCELGDIRQLVADDGLDEALMRLRREGVYFTFEEFKGREPVDRSGVSFELHPNDFVNRKANLHLAARTGGSTGPPVRVWMSLDDRIFRLPTLMVILDAHKLIGVRALIFDDPEASSVIHTLNHAGVVPERVFLPRGRLRRLETLRYEVMRRNVATAARLAGGSLPKLKWIDPQDPLPIVREAEVTLKRFGRCLIWAGVSTAVRVGSTAAELGVSLQGAVIMGNDEPATPAKVRAITSSGAEWFPVYGSYETGYCADGCLNPLDGSDVHLMRDRLAVTQHPRKVPGSALEVGAFNFTMLWRRTSMVLMNVELDDFGILENRSCGCPLEQVGYTTHLREIYSFRKLTGEGVTLVGSDMLRILEEVLPSRFGGTPLDYQLIEEEDENNLTKLSLLIHPRVEIRDETLVIKTVLQELKSGGGSSSMAGTIWAQAGTFRVKREKPIATAAGKLMPLHVSRRQSARN